MKKFHSLINLIGLLLAICAIGLSVTTAPPQIQSVSMDLVTWKQPRVSVAGGTLIYIRGFNFGEDSSVVQVFIDKYPCNIVDNGVTKSVITCQVTPYTDPTRFWALTVHVTVNGIRTSCSSSLCQVHFDINKTPFIYQIWPRNSIGGREVNFIGKHRISALGDSRSFGQGEIRHIKIDNTICSLVDVINADQINPNGVQPIGCTVFRNQESGEYNVTQNVFSGYAQKSSRMRYSSLFNDYSHEFRVVPSLSSISQTTGGEAGSIVSVSGSGFPSELSKYQCKVAGQACQVKSVSKSTPGAEGAADRIQIEIPALDVSNTLKGQIIAGSGLYPNGNGFKYTKYTRGNLYLTDSVIQSIRSGSFANKVIDDRITTELSSASIGENNYFEYVRGFFHAPVAGDYNFAIVVDDAATVFLSSVPNSKLSANMNNILKVNSYSDDNYHPYTREGQIDTKTVSITTPGYYYMEIITADWGGGAQYKLMVDTPQLPNLNAPANPTWQISRFQLRPDPSNVDPEIWTFTFDKTGFASFAYACYQKDAWGNYVLKKTSPINLSVVANNQNITVQHNGAWAGLSNIWNYRPQISFQEVGSIVTITFKFFKYRKAVINDATLKKILFFAIKSDGTQVQLGSSAALMVQDHSAPISGNYSLTLNVKDNGGAVVATHTMSNISYDYGFWSIEAIMRERLGLPEIEVSKVVDTYLEDQIIYIFEFVGTRYQVQITADVSFLVGGVNINQPFAKNIIAKRPYSATRPLFNPIPFDLLINLADKPSLELKVGNIPALNRYPIEFNYLPASNIVVNGSTLTSNTIKFSFSSTVSLQDIKLVELAGSICGTVSSTATAGEFQCSFADLNAGTNQKPKILIAGKGFAKTDGITGVNIPLTVTSVSPNKCGNNGGIAVTISGVGFPNNNQLTDYTKANDLIITICDQQIPQSSILSVANTNIRIKVPAYGGSCTTSSVTFAGQTSPLTFTYDNTIGPLISSLNFTSSSPIVKKPIKIIGNNFRDKTNTFVTLTSRVNPSKIYTLSILTISPTEIQAILGGGKTGVYDLAVTTPQGKSAALQFKYEVTITSVSTSGKKEPGGGYQMTITGTNFIPKTGLTSSMLVFLYESLICPIVSATETQIICTVPKKRIEDSFNVLTQVVVTSRITQQSKCVAANTDDCKFAYSDTNLAKAEIHANSTAFYGRTVGSQITIFGGANTDMNAVNQVKIGKVAASIVSKTAAQIVVQYPRLAAGSLYQVEITFDHSGIIYKNYPQIFANNTASVDGFKRKDGSNFAKPISTEGTIVLANVAGFPTSANNKALQVYLTCTGIRQDLRILSVTSSIVQFLIPAKVHNTQCDFNISYKFKRPTEDFFTYAFKEQKSVNFSSSSTFTDLTVSALTTDYFTITNPNNRAIYSVQLAFAGANGAPTATTFPMTFNSANGRYSSSSTLPTGTFIVRILSSNGFAKIATTLQKGWTVSPSITQAQSVSYAGGQNLVIQGSSFVQDNGKGSLSDNDIRICGLRAKPIAADGSSITVEIPALVNKKTQQLYQLTEDTVVQGNPNSDGQGTRPAWNTFDGSDSTFYSSSNMTECFIGLDFGVDAVVDVQKIRFDPSNLWLRAPEKLKGSIFEGYDGSQWVQIFAVNTNTAHSGWNFWNRPNVNANFIFSAIRFRHTNPNVSNSESYSQCQLAGIQIIGKVYSTLQTTVSSGQPADNQCSVEVWNSGQGVGLNHNITYSHSKTAVITKITPTFGPSSGNQRIHLEGSNLIGTVVVKIDGIDCVVDSVASNQTDIFCTTGLRAAPPAEGNSFIVTTNNNRVKVSTKPYLYVDRFSAAETWGGETPPRGALPAKLGETQEQGDSIHVPVGQTLLIDQSVPDTLYAVIVEGKVIFADQKDMEFNAKYFVLNDGSEFVAGTEDAPYQHKLTITMHGDYYADKHLPMFGNKGIGCKNCKFSMHGKVRQPTWTELSKTAVKGTKIIEVIHAVDWQAGQEIVIASTTHYIHEAERMIIQSVDPSGKIITLTQNLNYTHISVVQSYDSGNRQITMRGEVGLLTRNILMQGDPQYEKHGLDHGSHLLLTGKQSQGLIGHIAYAEFRFCGQPKVVGRYCTHFHMAGQVPNSYVRGISVHDSHARMLTIHGTHYLTVEKNVGYQIKGHNIFLEDGIETNNVIQDNLLINSLVSLTMTASDVTVASYWITNPYNTVRRNHAAGGQFYGFWYEIFEHPTGPSSTSDVCPMGMPVQQSKDNVAHSYIRFGLRIFKLSSRENPCETTQKITQIDPYGHNTPIHSVFDNYTLWRNQQCGFLGEKLGYMTIQNFKVADNFKGGMQFHKTNYTDPVRKPVVAKDCLIVGKSQAIVSENNAVTLGKFQYEQLLHETRYGTRGLYVSRTNGFQAQKIHFANFDTNMTPLQSCSECWHFKLWVVGSKTAKFRQISYENIQDNYIYWQKWQRDIFIDEDGTLTKKSRTDNGIDAILPFASLPIQITPYRANLVKPASINGQNITIASQSECYFDNNVHKTFFVNKWNSSVFCQKGGSENPANTLRGILFANMQPAIDFKGVDLRVRMLTSPTQNISSQTIKMFGVANQIIIKPPSNDIPGAFAMPFRTGKIYNIHWKEGIDFQHMSIAPSSHWQSAEQRVLLRFPYYDMREIIEVQRFHSKALQGKLIALQASNVQDSWQYFGQQQTSIDPLTEKEVKSFKYNASLSEAPRCKNGQYFNDRQNRFLWICVSGQSANDIKSSETGKLLKPIHQWIDVVGIKCRLQCPGMLATERFPRFWRTSSIWPNEVIPSIENERNATILSNYSVTVDDDISQLNLDFLIINGQLNINQVVGGRTLVIRARRIIVAQGAAFYIGTPQNPITNSKITIYLNGTKTDVYSVLDPTASGNKMLGVSGTIGFYAKSPENTWTKLSKIAVVGSTTIEVLNTTGWSIGDQLVIAPTYKNKNEHEKRTIQSISGKIVTLTQALTFEHYGSATTSASRSAQSDPNGEGRDLDARGAVGLLTRRIKITNGTNGTGQDEWGCRILVSATSKVDPESGMQIVSRGVVQLSGVQVSGCGQYDSTMAGLRIQHLGSHQQSVFNRTNGENKTVTFKSNIKTQTSQLLLSYLRNHTNFVKDSSIHTCNGYCMYVENTRDLIVSNNVFYHAQRQIVHVDTVFNYTFTDNLLVWAHKRPELTATLAQTHITEDVACYQQFEELVTADPKGAFVEVTRNLAQGSEGQGFVFPYVDCTYLADYPFQHNTAGSCEIGFMIEKLYDISPKCLAAKSMTAYASQVGLQANPPGSHIKMIYENAFFSDNQRGITLRFAHETDDNTMIFRNSEILGYSRQNENIHSTSKSWCQDAHAVRMFTATISGQTFPLKKPAMVHDVICTQQAFDFKAFLLNVVFQNFRNEQPASSNVSSCTRMSVFRRHHGASDGSAPHYLKNSPCKNCDKKGLAYFQMPNPGWFGWFGGCGQDMNCTGPDNILIHDTDGKFVGQATGLESPAQIYGQGVYQKGNTQASYDQSGTECQDITTTSPSDSKFLCRHEKLVLLQYESLAPDRQTRKNYPITIYDDEKYSGRNTPAKYSQTNGWKQWQWDGPEPMNRRIARFWSVVRKDRTYNITYASQAPANSRYQLNRRNPLDNAIPKTELQWLVLRVFYPLPNTIEVLVNSQLIKPQIIGNNGPIDLTKGNCKDQKTNAEGVCRQICGANNFHFENGTIEFVVNNQDNCQVQVRVTSSIKISMRLDIPVSDFFRNTGTTNFIDNIAAFLNIDPGRIKIVGVRTGSTIIDYFITALAQADPVENQQTYQQLSNIVESLKEAVASGTLDFGGAVLDFDAQINIFSADGNTFIPTSEQSGIVTILVAVLVPVLVVLVAVAIGVGCYLKRRRAKIDNDEEFEQANSSDMVNDKPTREFIQAQKINNQLMVSEISS